MEADPLFRPLAFYSWNLFSILWALLPSLSFHSAHTLKLKCVRATFLLNFLGFIERQRKQERVFALGNLF